MYTFEINGASISQNLHVNYARSDTCQSAHSSARASGRIRGRPLCAHEGAVSSGARHGTFRSRPWPPSGGQGVGGTRCPKPRPESAEAGLRSALDLCDQALMAGRTLGLGTVDVGGLGDEVGVHGVSSGSGAGVVPSTDSRLAPRPPAAHRQSALDPRLLPALDRGSRPLRPVGTRLRREGHSASAVRIRPRAPLPPRSSGA